MGADVAAVLNHAAVAAVEHLWRACWQGGLVFGLIWGACRLCPRCSPEVRCWLWRLAYLKLLAALAWGGVSVELPVLPAAPATGAGRQAIEPERLRTPASRTSIERWTVAAPSASSASVPTPSEGGGAGLANARPRQTLARAASVLILLWLAGVSWRGARMAREWRASRRLIRKGIRVTDGPLVAECARVCRRFGLERAPRLWLSEDAGSPVLAGAVRPAICLPPSLVESCTTGELRLVMAHELAHLKRRDLLWAWLPAVAGGLFFFHPLVWLAGREWRLAQEMACDALAVRVTGSPVLEYGQMVLKVAAQRRTHVFGEPAVASAAGAYQNLRRRLVAIQQIRPGTSRRQRLAGAVLLAAGIAVMMPWRATARADGAPPSSSLREQRQAEEAERLREQAERAHQQQLAEQDRLRRLEILAHERRMAEREHARRLSVRDHERRMAELEHRRRLAVQAHEQREAVLEQQRLIDKVAHERRMNHQEHARIRAALTESQQRAIRADALRLEELLLRHRQQALELRQHMAQQQRQMAATRVAMQSLSQQLDALQAQQQALQAQQRVLEARRHELEVMTLRQRMQEQAVQGRLQQLRSRRAPGRSGDRKRSP